MADHYPQRRHRVHLYTYVKRVPSELAAGKAREAMDKIHQTMSTPASAATEMQACVEFVAHHCAACAPFFPRPSKSYFGVAHSSLPDPEPLPPSMECVAHHCTACTVSSQAPIGRDQSFSFAPGSLTHAEPLSPNLQISRRLPSGSLLQAPRRQSHQRMRIPSTSSVYLSLYVGKRGMGRGRGDTGAGGGGGGRPPPPRPRRRPPPPPQNYDPFLSRLYSWKPACLYAVWWCG